jgi:predicted nucleotidyltransferase
MKEHAITRQAVIEPFITALKPLDYVHSVWEAGAAAFNRIDEWSDIDLYIVVDDDRVEEVIHEIDSTVASIAECDIRFRVPEPTWHGHSQVFYRLKNASPFLLLDIAIMKKSSKDKFLQYKIHGTPKIHFDKSGVVVDDTVDTKAFLNKLEKRLDTLRSTFPLFLVFTLKELNRGNDMTALSFYMSYAIRPLIEILRIKYCPYHHNFHTYYIDYELPPEIIERLRRLFYVSEPEQIREFLPEVEKWFTEEIESIAIEEVEKKL